ncbi:MAG: metallopeptidase family protein [Phycisphaeraceae bacterium]|nr:metallopeptidase family protein [Phycisphaeraceae bacterium]
MDILPRRERARFDRLLETVLDDLPAALRDLLEDAPLIVDDAPDDALLRELGMDPAADDLCGLHTGVPLTERSVEGGGETEQIHLFRAGIIDHAGGWEAGEDAVRREIRVTLLHEIGHHFGLDENDLEALGYA